jgi:ketosteroid isomerase-like protein
LDARNCVQRDLQMVLSRVHTGGMKESDVAARFKEVQEQNIALTRHLYAAFTQGDVAALLEVLSPDIDWLFYGPADIPFAGHYHGHQQVSEFFAQALDTSEFLLFEPREFLPGVNTVLVQGFERVRARPTGCVWETEWAHVFTIHNGKIQKLREYYDTSVIVAAFRAG